MVPTRKAARVKPQKKKASANDSPGSTLEAHLATIQASLGAISSMDLLNLSALQVSNLSSACNAVYDLIERRRVVLSTPESQVLPKDELIHVLGFLPPTSLAAAAQTCCHFDASVQQAVEQRIQSMFTRPFAEHHMSSNLFAQANGRFTSGVLGRLQTEMARSSTLINTLDETMTDDRQSEGACEAASDILDELNTFHPHVLVVRAPMLVAKIRSLLDSDKPKATRHLRSDLWRMLVTCNKRAGRYSEPVELPAGGPEALVQELHKKHKAFGAWVMFQEMPTAFIEANAAVVLRVLRKLTCDTHMSLGILEQLPRDVFHRIGADAVLAGFIQRQSEDILCPREEKKQARRILADKAASDDM